MTPIGTVGKIKITEDGMIANVNLDNSKRSDLMLHLFKLEDRQFKLEFNYVDIQKIREEIKTLGYEQIDKDLLRVQKKIDKEVKFIKKLMKALTK